MSKRVYVFCHWYTHRTWAIDKDDASVSRAISISILILDQQLEFPATFQMCSFRIATLTTESLFHVQPGNRTKELAFIQWIALLIPRSDSMTRRERCSPRLTSLTKGFYPLYLVLGFYPNDSTSNVNHGRSEHFVQIQQLWNRSDS